MLDEWGVIEKLTWLEDHQRCPFHPLCILLDRQTTFGLEVWMEEEKNRQPHHIVILKINQKSTLSEY